MNTKIVAFILIVLGGLMIASTHFVLGIILLILGFIVGGWLKVAWNAKGGDKS